MGTGNQVVERGDESKTKGEGKGATSTADLMICITMSFGISNFNSPVESGFQKCSSFPRNPRAELESRDLSEQLKLANTGRLYCDPLEVHTRLGLAEIKSRSLRRCHLWRNIR